MYAAIPVASRSSSSWISSPDWSAEQTTRVGARSSFARRLGPGGLLQALERLRAEDAEAPRVGEVVVRRPAGQLEQLVEHLPRHRARADTPCACGERESPRRPPSGPAYGRRRRYQRKPPPRAAATAPSAGEGPGPFIARTPRGSPVPALSEHPPTPASRPPPACRTRRPGLRRRWMRRRPYLLRSYRPRDSRRPGRRRLRPRTSPPRRPRPRPSLPSLPSRRARAGRRARDARGTRPSGKARGSTASRACEVTQTGVWSVAPE